VGNADTNAYNSYSALHKSMESSNLTDQQAN